MEDFSLQVEKRMVAGHKARHLRAEGLVPAVVYGGNEAAQNIQPGARELDRTLDKGGAATLLNLVGPGGIGKTRLALTDP